MSEEDDIRRLARTIRQRFIEAKTAALRKKYKPNDRHDRPQFYEAAARQCYALKADPSDYVQAAIENCQIRGGPFPNQLGGPAAARWYKEKMRAMGMKSDPVLPKEVLQESGVEEPKERVYACDIDLQMDLDLAIAKFMNNSGSPDPHHPKNVEVMLDPRKGLQCTALCLLGGWNPDVLTKYGERIYDFFKTHPNYIEAARRLNFPIDETLQWINSQVL